MNQKKKEYIGLTELRGIACIFVFISHLSYITRPYLYVGFLGHYGVMIFLMLSGFLGYTNHNVETFETIPYIKKKYKSFFGLYILFILVMAVPKILKHDFRRTFYSIVIHIPLLQTWLFPLISGYELNPVDWYLSVIMFCWLLEKPIIRLLKKQEHKGNLVIIALTIFLMRILLYYPPQVADNAIYEQFLYLLPIVRIMDFIIGMLLARYIEISNHNKNFEAISICIFLLSIIAYNTIPIKCKEVIFAGIGSLCLVSVFADNESILIKMLNIKWLNIIAKHSLTIYLAHYSVIYYTIAISSKLNIPIFPRLFIAILVIIICTWLIDTLLYKLSFFHRKEDRGKNN